MPELGAFGASGAVVRNEVLGAIQEIDQLFTLLTQVVGVQVLEFEHTPARVR